MGYVKKEKMLEHEGRPCTIIGEYYVIKNSDHMTGIYADNGNRLVTSKPKWSQAIKLANLLNDAYKEGYSKARDLYYEDAWRD